MNSLENKKWCFHNYKNLYNFQQQLIKSRFQSFSMKINKSASHNVINSNHWSGEIKAIYFYILSFIITDIHYYFAFKKKFFKLCLGLLQIVYLYISFHYIRKRNFLIIFWLIFKFLNHTNTAKFFVLVLVFIPIFWFRWNLTEFSMLFTFFQMWLITNYEELNVTMANYKK